MENNTSRREAGAWAKFRLLMWKNYLQQRRHPLQTGVELLLPVFCMAFMLLLRSQMPPELKDGVQFTPMQVTYLNRNAKAILNRMDVTQMSIAYSPQNDVLEGVVTDAVSDILISNAADLIRLPGLNITLPPDFDLEAANRTTILEILISVMNLRVQGYASGADLKSIYSREEIVWTTLAAVEFDDSLRDVTELPSNISYALRFPERPRLSAIMRLLAGVSWRTDVLFPALDEAGPRERFDSDGGNDPGYFGEMFIALQHAISTVLVSRITGDPLQAFDIKLQRFPHPPYVSDVSAEVFQMVFPTFLMVSFSYAAITTVRAITTEKELQLKETMKIMGMPTWIHWTSWFCKQYTFLLLPIALMMMLLKVNVFTNEQGLQYAVLTNTPWSVLLVFLLLYVACAIFFGFMISGFFSKGTTSSIFTGVLWYVTYIPAYIMTMDVKMSTGMQYFTCLSINSAMSFGAQMILAKEDIGGLQWSDFFSSSTTEASQLQFGIVMIMMIVNCVLYMLIALYVEQVLPGPYGTPKPWYFLFHRKFWSFNNKISSDDVMTQIHDLTDDSEIIKEIDPTDHAVGVKMTNMTKVFGKDVAVNNLSLNIFDDQITVLLGHNGAGKSTTISMLTGNLPVTQGSVWVAGYDMTWNTSEARAHIGLCPQHNVLFNDLTVKEHLEFFARLKGFHGKELYDEIDVLLDKLELQEKRNERAKGLSGGQKRRLCVGIALCGDARVVLLDEPTSGMDPSSRRALWDLLQKEKKGRSMILTTHFMDEADILGDRIAIMSSGRLQCVGSPYFLKKHYGVGYTLVIVKNYGFRLDICTQILAKHIPEISFKEDRGTEVVYNLLNEDLHLFESMLSDLEKNIECINFNNYGLTATTLEDVFMSVSSDVSPPHRGYTGTATESTESDNFSMDNLVTGKDIEGIRLVGQHMWAVWWKLWLVWLRSWPVALLQVLVPVLIMTATLGILQYLFNTTSPAVQRRPLTLAQGYSRTETLLNYEGDNSTSLGALAKRAYEDIFTSSGIPTMTVSVLQEPIDEYYLRETEDLGAMRQLRRRWLTGATFSDAGATAWFSNFGYHDIAVSLSAVHSALLRARHPTAEIHVSNHPLPVQYDNETDDTNVIKLVLSMQMASGVGSSLGIASAVFVMFYVKERMIRAKLLQQAAGIRPAVLWGSAAVFDWLWFLVISIFLVIPCTAFGVLGLTTFVELSRFYLLMMIYGASMLPFNYIASFLFKKPAMSFVVVFFVNIIFGSMGAQLVGALESPLISISSASSIANIIDYILQFFPLYSIVSAVRSLNSIGTTRFTCLQSCNLFPAEDNLECTMDLMCQRLEACCIGDNPYFKWEAPGVSRYMVAMMVTCTALWVVLMLIEYNICQRIFRRKINPPPLDMSTVDPDVRDEARHAEGLSAGQLPQHNLVARALTKYYGKYLAVNQVSFSVSDGECFGLLGVNGAGKTTTFKMLMGDEAVSCGDAYVGGYSIRKDINKVHENIGYCPQFDALFGELTGRETLRLYSLIHGFSPQHMASRTEALADALSFTKYLDKKVNQYSGGNKRKLSTAVSLLGHTRLVFVDEPTTGVDPAAKRQVWRAIRDATRAERGVVLTSHSMEECEALCSRLTIMVNGRFQCLGSPQHLKNKYSQGFILTIKIKMEREHLASYQQFVDAVKEYVESNFTNTKLMEQYQGLLTYYLEDSRTAWSRMFGVMERAKRDLHIEDYSISQTTLEQIFLKFTKYQR